MYTSLQDLRLIKQKKQNKSIKIELLDKKTGVVLERVDGALVSDSGTIDRQSTSRRTYNADFYIKDSTFLVDENSKVWLDKYLRVYVGIQDIRTQEYCWYILGTFAITEAGYSYSPTENTVSLTLTDKMAFLDGTLGGIVTGAMNIKIQRFVNDQYYSTVKLDSQNNYVTFGAGTTLIIPVPTSSVDTNSVKIKFDIYQGEKLEDANANSFLVNYDKKIKDTGKTVSVCKKYSISQVLEGVVIEEVSSYSISTVKITMLEDINVTNLYVYVNDNINPIVSYVFNGENNITSPAIDTNSDSYKNTSNYMSEYISITNQYQNGEFNQNENPYTTYTQYLSKLCDKYGYTLYQDSFGNNVVNGYIIQFSVSDGTWQAIGNADSIFTNSVKSYNSSFTENGWTVSKLIIDTTVGRETFVEDVIEAGLKTAGITEYEIRDVHEVIPYDQEFSVGTNWCEVFNTLIQLYQDIQMYFDPYGTFIVEYYSTTEDDDIVIDNNTLEPLVQSISYNTNFSEVHNVTEVWGQSIEQDDYAENTEEEPNLVKFSDNNFSVNFTGLTLTDEGKIPNNAVLAFKTPENISLTASPTLTINSIKTATANIESIDKIFTCDELELDESTKTGYRIDRDLTYAVQAGSVVIDTEDIIVSGLGYKDIPNNGEDNWSSYGARNANKIYTDSNGSVVSIPNVLGTNNTPVIVDGINFYGTFYNMRNASNMVNITSNTYSIDLSIKNYCIEINAVEGEIYRLYYTNLNGNLYAAKSNGTFSKTNRPFITYENAVNGMSYCDFVAPSTGIFYIFWYTADSKDISFRLYGISKVTAQQGEYPILNYTTDTPVDYTIFQPNTSYCFEYINGKIYYLGQWQIHAVAIEVIDIPQKGTEEYDYYTNLFQSSNIIFTQRDPRFAVENIGIHSQSLSGDVYEDIFTDDLALQRAEWENWKSIRLSDNVSLTTIQIPWLDVAEKLTYKLPNKQLKTYMVENISFSNSSETMTISMSTFYPLYIS